MWTELHEELHSLVSEDFKEQIQMTPGLGQAFIEGLVEIATHSIGEMHDKAYDGRPGMINTSHKYAYTDEMALVEGIVGEEYEYHGQTLTLSWDTVYKAMFTGDEESTKQVVAAGSYHASRE